MNSGRDGDDEDDAATTSTHLKMFEMRVCITYLEYECKIARCGRPLFLWVLNEGNAEKLMQKIVYKDLVYVFAAPSALLTNKLTLLRNISSILKQRNNLSSDGTKVNKWNSVFHFLV